MAERRWLDVVLVIAAASVLAVVVTELWRGYLDLPFGYERDGVLHLAFIQNQIESGSWLWGPRLAAPFEASNADFPLGGERLSWVGLWLLAKITGKAAVAGNLWVLISYPAVAVAAYFGARKLELSRTTSVVLALIFAFLPYHLARANAHLLRVAYVGVPLAGYWIVRVLDGRPFETRERRWLLASGAAVACCDTQHAIFFVGLFGLGALVVAAGRRQWAPIVLSLALAGATGGMLCINNAPYLAARIEQGKNPVAAHRVVSEQERYGLRIAQMVLPPTGHRIAALSQLKARSRVETLAKSEDGQSLGLLGVVGLAWAVFAALFAAVSPRANASTPANEESREADATADATSLSARLGVLCIVAMLVATGTGFAYLLSLAGFTMMRTWNRISLFIAWFALLALGVLLDRWWRRMADRERPIWLPVLTAVGVAVVGLLDTTPPIRVPAHEANKARWEADFQFFRVAEKGLGSGALVAQWPYQRFPEPPDLHAMPAYEHLKAYLHTDTLRWSYGGMAGRDTGDWQLALSRFHPSTRVTILAAAGFDALYLDRSGLPNDPREGTQLEHEFLPLTGGSIHRDDEGRRVLYDLRKLAARLEADGIAKLEPDTLAQIAPRVVTKWGITFFDEEHRRGDSWRWSKKRGHTRIELDRGAKAVRVIFDAKLSTRSAQTGVIHVEGPGLDERVEIIEGRGWISFEVDVPEEGVDLWWTYEGEPQPTTPDDRRALSFRVINPMVYGTHRARELDCWARAADPTREACRPATTQSASTAP